MVHGNAPYHGPIDTGDLAEALLFYQRVHLIVGEAELSRLFESIGLDTMLRLMEDGFLSVHFVLDGMATHASTKLGETAFDYIYWEKAKGPDRLRTALDVAKEAVGRVESRKGKSRRAAIRLLNHATVGRIDDLFKAEQSINEMARCDLEDPEYVEQGIASILESLLGVPFREDWRFQVARGSDGFRVDTNIPLPALTAKLQDRYRTDSEVTPALLLDFLGGARFNLAIAAELESEVLTSEISSALIQCLLRSPRRFGLGVRQDLAQFQQVVLEGRSVGDVIRSGERTFDDLSKVIEESQRFKEWIKGCSQDANILAEYHRSITEQSWLKSAPAKRLRFLLFTGAGLVADAVATGGLGTMAGVSASAFDTFVLDRIVGGWKPDLFVNQALKEFTNSQSG